MIHKPLIGIVGPSGSGKSTSLRGLDPATTVILDGERKGFPFKGGEKFRIRPFTTHFEFEKLLGEAIADTKVKNIVVESFTKYSEQIKLFCATTYKGYDVWSNYAKNMRALLEKVKNTNANIIFTAIDEIVKIPQVDGSETCRRCISIEGQELKGKIEKEFLLVLFTEPRKNKDGKMEYLFQTNTDGITTAKSPMDMFRDMNIPNDMSAVLTAMEKYYSTI